jgi:hypothetical protein
MKITLCDKPQKHDYPNAASYLSLTMSTESVRQTVAALKEAPMTEYAAKDIFRSSRLSLLGVSNSHVQEDQAIIIREEELSPLLLVRDVPNGKLIIADKYHRLCAVYTFDEDALIPCKIV